MSEFPTFLVVCMRRGGGKAGNLEIREEGGGVQKMPVHHLHFNQLGKTNTNKIWSETYQEIVRLDTEEFPEVPECYWCICLEAEVTVVMCRCQIAALPAMRQFINTPLLQNRTQRDRRGSHRRAGEPKPADSSSLRDGEKTSGRCHNTSDLTLCEQPAVSRQGF